MRDGGWGMGDGGWGMGEWGAVAEEAGLTGVGFEW